MSFFFENLDLKTREYMIREIDFDMSEGTLFLSPRLRPGCGALYVSYLRAAARAHNEMWLADQIRMNRLLRHEEERTSPLHGLFMLKVPLTAPDSLAAAEFNRFYARGVCARAAALGIELVEVYRARAVPQLHPESESIIGRKVAAEPLLRQLRVAPGLEIALGLPHGASAGVTVRLPARANNGRRSRPKRRGNCRGDGVAELRGRRPAPPPLPPEHLSRDPRPVDRLGVPLFVPRANHPPALAGKPPWG